MKNHRMKETIKKICLILITIQDKANKWIEKPENMQNFLLKHNLNYQ